MKNHKETILDRVSIAAPCNADWNQMIGDERERFCHQCQLNVYNISSMSTLEAEEFLSLRNQGRLCVQFYKRKDGTIITDNCPSGLKAIRDRSRKMLKTASTFIAFIATSNLFAWAQQQTNNQAPKTPTRGKVLIQKESETNLLRGDVYIPPQKSQPSCYLDTEKTFKDKLANLKYKNKDNLAIARAHLDLASFYRSKNHLQESDDEYAAAVKLLSKMSKESDLYKNSILNRIAVLKLLGKQKTAAKLEKILSKIK